MEEHELWLMNDDKTKILKIWFLGYSVEYIENYIKEKFTKPTNCMKMFTCYKIIT